VFDLTLVVTHVTPPPFHTISGNCCCYSTPPNHPSQIYSLYEVSFSRDPSFQRNLPELHLGGISQKIFTFGTIGEFRVRNWNWKSNVTNVLTIHICNIIKCWIYDELIYLSGELFTPAKV